MEFAIEIENISKVYKRKRQVGSKLSSEQFWALNNININIPDGQIVGFVGKNGAGKSTLLKILSRITSPTTGRVRMRGRVGSLLEVGTGFHPEMTGRENIYMNGTILGMSSEEISRKLESIVDFSGVASFVDMPIKRYSSGMQARLAFSVAAHLEPEIMIIDEVLAVGDAEFQRRCLGKMKEIGQEGRTVLFVSHNMNAIKSLCNRCVWLKGGVVVEDSLRTDHVVNRYLAETTSGVSAGSCWTPGSGGNREDLVSIRPKLFGVFDAKGVVIDRIASGNENIFVHIEFESITEIHNLSIGYAIYDNNSNLLYISYTTDSHYFGISSYKRGNHCLRSEIPVSVLNDGDYTLQLIAGVQGGHSILSRDESDIMIKLVIDGNGDRSSFWNALRPTAIAPVIRWSQE